MHFELVMIDFHHHVAILDDFRQFHALWELQILTTGTFPLDGSMIYYNKRLSTHIHKCKTCIVEENQQKRNLNSCDGDPWDSAP